MTKWQNISLKWKLVVMCLGIFVAGVGILAIIVFVSQSQLNRINTKVTSGYQIQAVMLEKEIDHLNWCAKLQTWLMERDASKPLTIQQDPHKCAFGKWYDDPEGRGATEKIFPRVAEVLGKIDTPHNLLHGSSQEILAVITNKSLADPWTVANQLYKDKSLAGLLGVQGYLAEIRKSIGGDLEVLNIEAHQVDASMRKWLLASTLLLFVLAGLAAWGFACAIGNPIRMGSELLTSVATRGDLAMDFDSRYTQRGDEIGQLGKSIQTLIDYQRKERAMTGEMAAGNWILDIPLRSEQDDLGKALQMLIGKINQALALVRSSADEVSSGTGQIADASQSLSQGATETAASLEEISASATEIGSQARHNAETATQANHLAAAAKESAETGSQRMKKLNASMAAITESSAQIAKIIKTIDDIAFQTNILALNAAVEAARAGRHGKGFAVVAEEVRSLAARSAKAARETADLIEGSKNRVDEGNRIAKETAEALSEIVAGIVKVGDLVGEMAAASNEQAQGIAQISQGLSQIDQVTQQNTATAEETAAASEELSGQADELRALISQFKLKGGHVSAPAHAAPQKTIAAKPAQARRALGPAVKPAQPAKAAPTAKEGWNSMAKNHPAKPAVNEEIISLEG